MLHLPPFWLYSHNSIFVRWAVSVELGLPVATGGFGFDPSKNEHERRNMDEAIRKILIATGAGPAAMMLE